MASTNITTLLIIGNGFDLQCGLRTSYADFFDWLRKDSKRANDNFWAVHFLNNIPTGSGWVDVEAKLLNTLTKSSPRGRLFLEQCVRDVIDYYSKLNRFGGTHPSSLEEAESV